MMPLSGRIGMMVALICVPILRAAVFHVAPTGSDSNDGSEAKPFATPGRAQQAARTIVRREAVRVVLAAGTYTLPTPLVFTAADSGRESSPVEYLAAGGQEVVLSGSQPLQLKWEPYTNGIVQASTPPDLVIDQLYVNGWAQPMARYPNFDIAVAHFNGFAPDAISPERVARWADPKGGYIHAMHEAMWGDMHWMIRGKKPDGTLDYEGGWQNNRSSSMHPTYRFVENLFEELDAPGEWYHDAKSGKLYYLPEPGLDLAKSTFESVRMPHLVVFSGTRERSVRNIAFRGITFRHTGRTFMDNREPLLRSDWTIYRGGAVSMTGTEDCRILDCTFEQLGGNALFVNKYNRRLLVKGCLFREIGANGVSFVGDPRAVRSPLFNYEQKFDYKDIDRQPGTLSQEFPSECTVEDCLIVSTGRVEKQTAGVQISMSRNITIRQCSIYRMPRAGINVSEGTWGGHLIEDCDIFDTVLETGDHGSWNSWGRDRFWHPNIHEVDRQVAKDPALPFLDAGRPTILRHNRWRCDNGWDIDLDDGSSNYVICNNLLLHGGLKLREGYRRIATNNIILNNSLHPHCWYQRSGDIFRNNIVFKAYQPAGGMPVERWGAEVDANLFASSESDRTRFLQQGCDANSVTADPLFVDAESGNFQVRPESPAIKLGFRNFAMDTFGVQKPVLKDQARRPVMPKVSVQIDLSPPAPISETGFEWRGGRVRDLRGEEYSAYGVPRDAGGVVLTRLSKGAKALNDGFESEDLIQTVNGKPVRSVKELARVLVKEGNGPVVLGVVRQQSPKKVVLQSGSEPPRI